MRVNWGKGQHRRYFFLTLESVLSSDSFSPATSVKNWHLPAFSLARRVASTCR